MKKDGKKICGYAATAKSTTVLNYCNLNMDTIDFICDTTNEKIGKFSPGMHIPIVPISHFHKNLPDVAYLFAWNHKDEIFSASVPRVSQPAAPKYQSAAGETLRQRLIRNPKSGITLTPALPFPQHPKPDTMKPPCLRIPVPKCRPYRSGQARISAAP